MTEPQCNWKVTMSKLRSLEPVISGIRNRLGRFVSGLQSRRVRSGEWANRLADIGGELDVLASSTESDFLAIGERLHGFRGRSGEISRLASSVAQMMAGDEIRSVTEGFHDLIGRVELLEKESRRSATTLQHLMEMIASLQGRISSFNNITRSLRILCISIRIESARLGERNIGFDVLADEVGKLAAEIEEQCSRLLAKTMELSHLVQQTLVKVSDLENKQHAHARVILERTMASLAPIAEKQRLSSSVTAGISTRFSSISRSMGEIVASMQFHDITRQRIEHAKEALDGILSTSRGGPGTASSADPSDQSHRAKRAWLPGGWLPFGENGTSSRSTGSEEQLRLAHDICELQIAQLSDAGKIVVSAIGNIVHNLAGIAGTVDEMVKETSKIAGSVDETGSSFLSQMEAAFSTVTAALSSYGETDRELSLIMHSVGETLGDMTSFAGAVEGIGERIKLIALNAIIKACHIGNEGLTLGVLAESIHHLSQETRKTTGAVSDSLRSINSESDSLCGTLSTEGATQRDNLSGVDNTVQTLLTGVRSATQNVASLLTRLHDDGFKLSHDISETIESITVHQKFEAVIARVVAWLEEISAACGSRLPADSQPGASEYIRDLEASYTMKNERDVYRTMLTPEAAGKYPAEDLPSPRQASSAADAGSGTTAVDETVEDLGDNVELF
jgi:methyl-accepting chemotaxis protein